MIFSSRRPSTAEPRKHGRSAEVEFEFERLRLVRYFRPSACDVEPSYETLASAPAVCSMDGPT